MARVQIGLQMLVAVSCLSLLGYISVIYNMSTAKYITNILSYKTPPYIRFDHMLKTNASTTLIARNTTINKTIKSEMEPLLTLFTTWPEGGSKTKVWNTTLRNWAGLRPMVRPLFFYTNERQANYIARHGWDVLPVRRIAASGPPVLKHMFLDAVKHFHSLFYGYSNGDIIFDDGIVYTLSSIANSSIFTTRKPVLITGIRTNIANLTEKETRNIHSLARVSEKRGKLFIPLSEDYFITDASYPWVDIPELVIGRVAYDNWLVLNARKQNHTVIDATKTLLAVHQTTERGNFEGWQSTDSNYNKDLLSKLHGSIDYGKGSTLCAPWMTTGDGKYNITVVQRKINT